MRKYAIQVRQVFHEYDIGYLSKINFKFKFLKNRMRCRYVITRRKNYIKFFETPEAAVKKLKKLQKYISKRNLSVTVNVVPMKKEREQE